MSSGPVIPIAASVQWETYFAACNALAALAVRDELAEHSDIKDELLNVVHIIRTASGGISI